MQDASYEFGEDETYLEYAKGLEQQAAEIAEAVKADSFERAQKAAGQLNKACVTCHEGYRS
jgi:cytochrome c556